MGRNDRFIIRNSSFVFFILVYAIIITGSTYAFLRLNASKNNITAQAGCFDVNYTGEEIKHTNLSTTTNYLEGAKSTVTISKANSCKIYSDANIYIHVSDGITAPIETVQALRYKVMQGDNQVSEGIIANKGDVLLVTVPITTTSTSYDIYIWIDSSLSNKEYDKTKFNGYIYAESEQTSTIETGRQVIFDLNGGSVPNLIYGLDNKSETTTNYMKYSISNGVVSVTALRDDGYGFTTGRVYLESGKTYVFNCSINGVWGTSGGSDTVEAFLMLNGQYQLYYHMNTNNNYQFTPTTTGTYWLRLDVNQNGKTYMFSNISIKEKDLVNGTKNVIYRKPYGPLPTPVKDGYSFKGWSGKNLVNISNQNITFSNDYYINQIPNPKYILQANTSYTLSFNYVVNTATNNIFASVGYGTTSFQRDIKNSVIYSGSGRLILMFTTPATFDYNPPYVAFRLTRMGSRGDANVDVSNVQLEEGSSATEYDPYYITNSTIVSQSQDHILTAIWE